VIRWLRLIATATVILSLIGLGIIAGLFLVANSGWVPVKIHPWLEDLFGSRPQEMWLPALIGGWLVSFILVATLILWSMFYVWRRRQYESLINKLERELAKLRNLPFVDPAPLEDLPETPSAEAARVMRALDAGDDDGIGVGVVGDRGASAR
jgi:H+/Cl- antiporter ClcA